METPSYEYLLHHYGHQAKEIVSLQNLLDECREDLRIKCLEISKLRLELKKRNLN